jgi:hypothetical protein
MKISALLFMLAFSVVLAASVRMWPSDQNLSHGWGLVTLVVLGLAAISIWRCVRIRRTVLQPKPLEGLTIATVIAFLFALMQWVSFSV